MARHIARNANDTRVWDHFAKRHKRSPFLGKNPNYALPEAVISIINREIPRLWSAEELEFERDLSSTTGGGFFHQIPFACPFPWDSRPSIEEVVTQDADAFQAQYPDASDRDLRDFRARRKTDLKLQADVTLRALAYTAWLITNSQFIAERDQYRALWEDRVAAARDFPAEPLSLLGEGPASIDIEQAWLLGFFRRWGLRTLLTWDIPVPMRPELFQVLRANSPALSEAGLVMFLPWHLLRDRRFKLEQVIEQLLEDKQPDHLDAWFSKTNKDRRKLGYKRLSNLLVLRWCLHLALAERYANRLDGRGEQLDRCFGQFLSTGADSVKKIRLSMATSGYPFTAR